MFRVAILVQTHRSIRFVIDIVGVARQPLFSKSRRSNAAGDCVIVIRRTGETDVEGQTTSLVVGHQHISVWQKR
jgi:hypothetical protein